MRRSRSGIDRANLRLLVNLRAAQNWAEVLGYADMAADLREKRKTPWNRLLTLAATADHKDADAELPEPGDEVGP